jgi:hypothetical protein
MVGDPVAPAELIYALGEDDSPRLAWKARFQAGGDAAALDVIADANTGATIRKLPQARGYDTITFLPTDIGCANLKCISAEVQPLHESFLLAGMYFEQVFKRNSNDNLGSNVFVR